ncbi:hypothetical protein U472_00885 [Orenia metallireducens]|uniref:Uncharacterized protein n=1 Tax=Orenia metallireducens TaxID=1413210 RepID=A0A1C0ACW9_9FIRM|nr:hypothetical protein [Orenia metallireducens]OCL28474.1 hypothetical protein U472_00885 [Orenia metallireducens]
MELSFIQLILAILPESLLISYVGLGLLGIRVKMVDYIKISVIYIFFLVIIRNIFKLYGLHVILGFLFFVVLFKIIVKVDWHISIISSLVGYIISFLGEVLIMPPILDWLKLDLVRIFNGNLIKFLVFFYLAKLPLMIAAILIYLCDFSIISIDREMENL